MSEAAQAPMGVLLMAYGSPNTLDEVLPYYTDIRGGRAPSPEQLAVIYDHYVRVGGNTGLLAISEAQVAALQERLDALAPGAYRVYLGMRHWHPFIADTIKRMATDGVREAVGIALAPHESRISVGGYITSVENGLAALAREQGTPSGASEASAPAIQFSYVRSWHVEPHFLRLLAERVTAARERAFGTERRDAVHIIFSAHSLPQRILSWNDPYPTQLRETATSVAQLLSLDETQWTLAYQSAGRTDEPWLGPTVNEVIAQLAERGVRAVLACPIGFIADNLEILYDIDIESRELAERAGVHLERIAMPNADPLLIEALASVTQQAAQVNTQA